MGGLPLLPASRPEKKLTVALPTSAALMTPRVTATPATPAKLTFSHRCSFFFEVQIFDLFYVFLDLEMKLCAMFVRLVLSHCVQCRSVVGQTQFVLTAQYNATKPKQALKSNQADRMLLHAMLLHTPQ